MPASIRRTVNIVPSSPDPAALVSGQIDAYTGYSTNQGVMLKARGVDIHSMNVQDFGLPETTGTIYGARGLPHREQASWSSRFLQAADEVAGGGRSTIRSPRPS